MPTKPLKVCAVVGCGQVTSKRYCIKHQDLLIIKDERPTSGKRGYNAGWQRIRKIKLAMNPVCECGCDKPAEMVHHRDEDSSNNAPDNLMSLTNRCHAKIHRKKIL